MRVPPHHHRPMPWTDLSGLQITKGCGISMRALGDSANPPRRASNRGSGEATGVVGDGRIFDGSSASIDIGVPPGWYGVNGEHLTVSLWARPSADPELDATPFGAAGVGESNALAIYMSPYIRFREWRAHVGGVFGRPGPKYDLEQWQQISLVCSNGAAYLSKNGEALMEVSDEAGITPSLAPLVGNRSGRSHFFDGLLDEIRLSSACRSRAWLRAAYRTVADHAAFTTYEPVKAPDSRWGRGWFAG